MYDCARLGYCQGQVKTVSDWLNPRHLEHLVTLKIQPKSGNHWIDLNLSSLKWYSLIHIAVYSVHSTLYRPTAWGKYPQPLYICFNNVSFMYLTAFQFQLDYFMANVLRRTN